MPAMHVFLTDVRNTSMDRPHHSCDHVPLLSHLTPWAVFLQLLTDGRTVVAAVRSKERGEEVLGQLAENFNKGSQLEVVEGVDVTQKSSLTSPELWRGVSQVAIAVGPVFGSGG